MTSLPRRLLAEFIGTALLLATVVGSGIMAESLSGGNTAIALLGNTAATGAILVVLITALGSLSGAHFNPAVTLIFTFRGELRAPESLAYIATQIIAAIAGVLLAHAMFGLDIVQASTKIRTGPAQWLSEAVATFGLILTILATVNSRPSFVPVAVGLYITAAYWFTASTSFANPAVTLARSLSDTFSGIRPADVAAFTTAQIAGAIVAAGVCHILFHPVRHKASS